MSFLICIREFLNACMSLKTKTNFNNSIIISYKSTEKVVLLTMNTMHECRLVLIRSTIVTFFLYLLSYVWMHFQYHTAVGSLPKLNSLCEALNILIITHMKEHASGEWLDSHRLYVDWNLPLKNSISNQVTTAVMTTYKWMTATFVAKLLIRQCVSIISLLYM